MSSDLIKYNRQLLEDFIRTYQNLPCLWRIKSKEYHDKTKRDTAYEILLGKYRLIDSNADKDAVVKKINALRTNYRREKKKVEASRQYGVGSGEILVYEPSLWYYPLFDVFLGDQETPNNLNETEIEYDTDSQSEDPFTASSYVASSVGRKLAHKRKRTCDEEQSLEGLTLVGDKVRASQATDKFTLFGNYIADKLRNVACNQSKFAEKLISEVLFEADMGSLNRNWRLQDTGESFSIARHLAHYYSGTATSSAAVQTSDFQGLTNLQSSSGQQ